MAPKERNGFLSLFCFGKKKADKATSHDEHNKIFNKYRHLGTSGYRTDLFVGKFHCGHCNKNNVAIYRSTLSHGNGFTEELRMEQDIKKAGNLMLHVPLTWEDEVTRLKKELPREKWDGKRETSYHGRQWVVVKKQVLAELKCAKCEGTLEISNKIVEEVGKTELKWYLCKREVKSTGTEKTGTMEQKK